MNLANWWSQGDGVTHWVAFLLLAMSVLSWVLMVFKLRQLHAGTRQVNTALDLFWRAPDMETARQHVVAVDAQRLLLPLLDSAQAIESGTLASAGEPASQMTRCLRGALQGVSRRLQWGLAVLASIGSTAPFVGLLGTVWGIFHALMELGASSAFGISAEMAPLSAMPAMTLDRLAAPVGEALVMTAAGLVVAIPAVLAYNLLSRRAADLTAELEGFAHDLNELLMAPVRRLG
ncbi:MAG: MotA/TolQ/ExbB proton channel family protein [Betaproteobacteria bacterium]|nr:MotA/TolQ/ExbB proton channel family protein [Betaproteobacteria bacterium]NBY72205.1 MotA/TolQ/ExbB proton channel family protein [Betaproteobacteria bacterium]